VEGWRREAVDGGKGWFDRFGDPWRLLDGLTDGSCDGIEVALNGVGEAGGVICYFLGVPLYVVRNSGELREG